MLSAIHIFELVILVAGSARIDTGVAVLWHLTVNEILCLVSSTDYSIKSVSNSSWLLTLSDARFCRCLRKPGQLGPEYRPMTLERTVGLAGVGQILLDGCSCGFLYYPDQVSHGNPPMVLEKNLVLAGAGISFYGNHVGRFASSDSHA
jgi:hypothetical protein